MSTDSDDMDLDALINNPFQYLGAEEESRQSTQDTQRQGQVTPARTPSSPAAGKHDAVSADQVTAGITIDRINKNHPVELRVLSVEKNQLNWVKKVEMLKEIVEHQNERIDLLEKELDLIRKKLGE